MRQQRGFSVPELLIAALLFISLAVATLSTMHALTRALDGRSTSQSGMLSMEQQVSRMRSDADTAFAVFVPQNDVLGFSNAAAANVAPHEVDFYTKTDTNSETWWAYYYDSAQHTLRRYDYDPATRRRGVFDRTTGSIDPQGQYPALTGVRAFSATSVQANELANGHYNKFAPLISGLTQGATPQADPVGFVPADGQPRTDLYGGNASVHIALSTDHGDRALHLVSGAMASGFTIHEALAIRSYIYRKNTHHHSWAGLVSKSRAHIYEQLQYSFDPRGGKPWNVWCDFELYGHTGEGGLDYSDRKVRYQPFDDFQSTAGYTFFIVTHNGVLGQIPIGCKPHYPLPNDTPMPTLTAPPPTYDETPPPCWSAGTCWPYNAPPNWSPPSPWPATSPPPDWCAGHQASPLCGGTGAGPTPTDNAGTAPPVDYTPPTPATAGPNGVH